MEFIKPGTKFDFMGKIKIALLVSGTLIALSILSVILHGGVKKGVDFTGGSIANIKIAGNATNATAIKDALKPLAFNTVEVQQYGKKEDNEFLIRVDRVSEETQSVADEMKVALEKSYGPGTIEVRSSDTVGAKVGAELRSKGTLAVIFAIICIFIYVAFRFKFEFATGAIVALAHDVIITVGALSVMNKEFDLTIIAALLTVVGYSINDTVIIYDRIRENLRKSKKKPLAEVINESINETLSRTILTSLTTVLAIICVFLFTQGGIHDFAFAMLVGIVTGTYSSIFIASPIVLWWQNKMAAKK